MIGIFLLLPTAVGALQVSPQLFRPTSTELLARSHPDAPTSIKCQPPTAETAGGAHKAFSASALFMSLLVVPPAAALNLGEAALQSGLQPMPPLFQLGVLAVLACPVFQMLDWEPKDEQPEQPEQPSASAPKAERSRPIQLMAAPKKGDEDKGGFTIGGFTSEQGSPAQIFTWTVALGIYALMFYGIANKAAGGS